MTKFIKILITINFILSYFILSAQPDFTSDAKLADEYYRNNEFDKAEVLYEKVYNKTNAKIFFNYYFDCLIQQKKYDLAEKQIKKQIKKHKKDLSYIVELGYLYKSQGNDEDAKKEFEKAIKKIENNKAYITGLANNFIRRKEYDYAVATYMKARHITRSPYLNELAVIYQIQRKYPEMIQQYLELLAINRKNLKTVQDRMQSLINKDVNDEISTVFKTEVLKRIRKDQNKTIFNELLIWYYIQKKEFRQAYIQAIAIDKRIHGSGYRIMELAESALSNNEIDVALDAYQYVSKKGRRSSYYSKAKTGRLDALYKKVELNQITLNEEIVALEKEYIETINELGLNQETVKNIIDLANIQAFYLNKPEEAKKILEDAINIVGLPKQVVAQCKITLGDILVSENDLDLSVLIYGQAEKDNTDNSYGDIAKLRKAKTAYYRTDFQWAKAQFDALKTSTSKPVANDALYYSLMIDDNIKDDSIQTALKIFAKGDLLIFRKKYDKAILKFDTLIQNFSSHQIYDDACMKTAEIYELKNAPEKAETYYLKLITERSYDILADLAVFKLATLYEEKLKDNEKAAEYYKMLMLQYPDSIFVTECRKRFRKIRDGI